MLHRNVMKERIGRKAAREERMKRGNKASMSSTGHASRAFSIPKGRKLEPREPVRCSKRSHRSETPALCSQEEPPLTGLRKPARSNEAPAQPKINK